MPRTVIFDTITYAIGFNNRCTAYVSHVAVDFIGKLYESNKTTKGFGGTKTSKLKVITLRWKWVDDEGTIIKFLVPNSYIYPKKEFGY